ncbi:hypothetical protein ZWY2020_057483 [Hordeum vulgare]|nr:hypothetical protein ZWY2020_057483 [Hordeum vulgare]
MHRSNPEPQFRPRPPSPRRRRDERGGLGVDNDTGVSWRRQRGIDVLLNAESNSKREWPAAVAFSHSARLLDAQPRAPHPPTPPSPAPSASSSSATAVPVQHPPRTARPSLAHASLPTRPARIASMSTPSRPDKGQGRRRRRDRRQEGRRAQTAVGVCEPKCGAESFATKDSVLSCPSLLTEC